MDSGKELFLLIGAPYTGPYTGPINSDVSTQPHAHQILGVHFYVPSQSPGEPFLPPSLPLRA